MNTTTMTTGWVKPSRSLVTDAGRAIGDYRMIRDGDRILLGLSGGKIRCRYCTPCIICNRKHR